MNNNPQRTYENDVSRLFRAVRFETTKHLSINQEDVDYIKSNGRRIFKANKNTLFSIGGEMLKIASNTENYIKMFNRIRALKLYPEISTDEEELESDLIYEYSCYEKSADFNESISAELRIFVFIYSLLKTSRRKNRDFIELIKLLMKKNGRKKELIQYFKGETPNGSTIILSEFKKFYGEDKFNKEFAPGEIKLDKVTAWLFNILEPLQMTNQEVHIQETKVRENSPDELNSQSLLTSSPEQDSSPREMRTGSPSLRTRNIATKLNKARDDSCISLTDDSGVNEFGKFGKARKLSDGDNSSPNSDSDSDSDSDSETLKDTYYKEGKSYLPDLTLEQIEHNDFESIQVLEPLGDSDDHQVIADNWKTVVQQDLDVFKYEHSISRFNNKARYEMIWRILNDQSSMSFNEYADFLVRHYLKAITINSQMAMASPEDVWTIIIAIYKTIELKVLTGANDDSMFDFKATLSFIPFQSFDSDDFKSIEFHYSRNQIGEKLGSIQKLMREANDSSKHGLTNRKDRDTRSKEDRI